MRIDMYGSRSFLVNILKLRSKLNIELNNAFTGTTIDSQMKKEIEIDEDRLKTFISNHEILEIKTDFQKRFRRFHSFSKSRIIIVDFMHEGKTLIKLKNGTVTKRPVLKRYGYNSKEAHDLSFNEKIKRIDEYVGTFIEYLSSYDLVIINKMRTPKYEKADSGELVLKKDIQGINFLNFYAETFEDILLQKKDNVVFIPEYKTVENLQEGYQNTSAYNNHLLKNIERIIKSSIKYN